MRPPPQRARREREPRSWRHWDSMPEKKPEQESNQSTDFPHHRPESNQSTDFPYQRRFHHRLESMLEKGSEQQRSHRNTDFQSGHSYHHSDSFQGPGSGHDNSSRYKTDSTPVTRLGFRDNNDKGLLSNENEGQWNTREYQPRRWQNQQVSQGMALVSENRTEEHPRPVNSSWDQPNRQWMKPASPPRAMVTRSERKMLVLDLNGLLADVTWDCPNTVKADAIITGKAVFKRPFCDDFLEFCFSNFDVGIWSSRQEKNVDRLVNFLFGDMRNNLVFCWGQSKCTSTGFGTIENQDKPLVLKELRKLWMKEDPNLPWEKGFYTPANTLLVDDSPYKALCNLPDTAIFPDPYHYTDTNDCSLGPGGEIRMFLEGLAMAGHVMSYVRSHPFGQPAITSQNPSWRFYRHIIQQFSYSSTRGR